MLIPPPQPSRVQESVWGGGAEAWEEVHRVWGGQGRREEVQEVGWRGGGGENGPHRKENIEAGPRVYTIRMLKEKKIY